MKLLFIKKWIAAIISVAAIIAVAYFAGSHKADNQIERLEQNQEFILSKNESLVIDSAKRMSELKTLSLTAEEFKKANTYLTDKVEELEISNKRLRSASASSYKVITKIETKVKDSLIFVHDTVPTFARMFDYTDAYTDVKGYVTTEDAVLNIHIRDTITHIMSYEPKRYLFGLIKCGKKYVKSTFANANPNATIVVQEAVEITDKQNKHVNGCP